MCIDMSNILQSEYTTSDKALLCMKYYALPSFIEATLKHFCCFVNRNTAETRFYLVDCASQKIIKDEKCLREYGTCVLVLEHKIGS